MGDPPIWPGDGQAMVWDEGSRSWHHPDNRLLCADPASDPTEYHFACLSSDYEARSHVSLQDAVDRLYRDLCEQADALAAVTGRGTVGDVVLAGFRVACDTMDPGCCHECGLLLNTLREAAEGGYLADLKRAVEAIERGEHVGGGRG